MSNNHGTILIAEDSPTQAARLQSVLQGCAHGYRTAVARDGQKAFDLAKLEKPGLVISDILMPNMDGYELCAAIKRDPELRSIPVVLLTSLTDAGDVVRGLNAGTDYYLTKPYEDAHLLRRVESILEGEATSSDDGPPSTLRMKFNEDEFEVAASKGQILRLLLSTYDNAVNQNAILRQVQQQLEELNEELEDRVEQRTRELSRANSALTEEIKERVKAEGQVKCQMERLQALRKIDIAITSSVDLSITLDVVLDQVTSQLDMDAATVLIFEPETQSLEFAGSRGFHNPPVLRTSSSHVHDWATQCVLERQSLFRSGLREFYGDNVSHFFEREGFETYAVSPLIAKGYVVGVLEVFHRRRFEAEREWLEFFDALAGQTAIAVNNAQLFEGLQRSSSELSIAYDSTLEGWSRVLDLRDKETEGHSARVTDTTQRMARAIGITGNELVHVRRGALLHDIGKMGVPDRILQKPGPLTAEEWEVMRKHPEYAKDMLAPIHFLQPAISIPYCHHERWDGSGYPQGLEGDAIPLAARVFAVADVWDALRSERPYHSAWNSRDALEYICDQTGRHFDPRVIEVFYSLFRDNAVTGCQPSS